MKKIFGSLCVLCVLCGEGLSQQQPAQDLVANTLTFKLQNPPQIVPVSSISLTNLDNPGAGQFCYWIVANYGVGPSAPSGPACIFNGPNSLVNGIRVSWTAPGPAPASSFDVLRTSNTTVPAGACACAIATSVTTFTAVDTGLNAYTVQTFAPSSVTFSMDNENGAGPGVSLLEWKVAGITVATLDSTGLFTPNSLAPSVLPATVVQTNKTNTYTNGDQNFGSALSLEVPQGGGLKPTAQGGLAFDFTAARLNYGDASLNHTIVAADTTDTLTHKTLDTAGAGNVLKINSNAISLVQGNTSKAQLGTSFTNGNFFSADANGNTADSGKVVPTGAVVGTTDSQTLSNKTIPSPAITGTASGNGTLPIGMVVPGTNGQCVITTGGASAWGTCAGLTAPQINTTTVSVSGNTSSAQNLQSVTFSAGVFNSVNKMFTVDWGGIFNAVNNSELVNFSLNIGPSGTSGGLIVVPTVAATTYSWSIHAVCVVTTTGATGVISCNMSGTAAQANAPSSAQVLGKFNVSSTPANVDLTSALTLQGTVTFGTASASNTASSQLLTAVPAN